MDSDEDFARKLQEQFDQEIQAAGVPAGNLLSNGNVNAGPSDEDYARKLQLQFDAEEDHGDYGVDDSEPAPSQDFDDEEMDIMEEDPMPPSFTPPKFWSFPGSLKRKQEEEEAPSAPSPKRHKAKFEASALLDISPSVVVDFFQHYSTKPRCNECGAQFLQATPVREGGCVTDSLSAIIFPSGAEAIACKDLETHVKDAVLLHCNCQVPGVCLGCFQVLTQGDIAAGPVNHCGAVRLVALYAALHKLAEVNRDDTKYREKPAGAASPTSRGRGRGRGRKARGGSASGVGYGTGNVYNPYGAPHEAGGTIEADDAYNAERDIDTSHCLATVCAFLPNSSRQTISDLLPHDCLSELLRKSVFLPLMISLLRSDSLLDITSRFPLYSAVLRVLDALTCHEVLFPLLTESYDDPTQMRRASSVISPPKGRSSRGKKGASSSSESQASAPDEAEKTVPLKTLLTSLVQQAQIFIKAASTNVGEDPQAIEALSLTLDLKTMSEDISRKINEFHELQQRGENAGGAEEVSVVATPRPVAPPEYEAVLKPLAFDQCDMVGDEVEPKSAGKQGAAYTNSAPSKRALYIAKETATLSTSLPISKASSIFVRADENRVDRMRAMISGPEGTPYAFGLWLFDVSYPVEYPNVPPVLKNLTTGNGTVRFNPNLYNEGKVCLSLLGTWSGSPEEMWRPGRSTILQVFISISSMIFVDLPYFNEPGYGAPNANNAQSQQYNYNIRRETIRWAVTEQLRRPPRGFEQVVQNHFRLLKSEVLAVATQWAEDDPGTNAYGVPNGGFPLAQSSTRGRGRGGKSRGRGRGNTNGSSSGSATPTPTEPSNGDKGKGVAEQPVYKGGWDVILRDLRAELEKL